MIDIDEFFVEEKLEMGEAPLVTQRKGDQRENEEEREAKEEFQFFFF